MAIGWQQWFQAYAAAAVEGDVQATAAFYAPSFLAAGPKGVRLFPERRNGPSTSPKRKQGTARLSLAFASGWYGPRDSESHRPVRNAG